MSQNPFWRKWSALDFNAQLFVILGAAIVVRIFWAAIVPVAPISDSNIYWITSNNLFHHGVYGIDPAKPFSYWPVGASGIYAASYHLFGANFFAVQIINIIAGAALIFTTALLAKKWFGNRVALITAMVMALWPSLIMNSTILASEIFYLLFVNIGLLAWYADRANLIVRAAIAGIAFGIAIYVRPVALLIPFVLVVIDIVRKPDRAMAVIAAGVACFAAAALCLSPWIARNYDVHGAFVIVSTNGGPNLWMGNNPKTKGGYMPLPDYTKEMTEIERAEHLGDIAKDYMISHPVKTVENSILRTLNTHSRETIAVVWNETGITQTFGAWAVAPFKAVSSAYWLIIFGISLVAIVLFIQAALRADTYYRKLTVISHPAIVLVAYYIAVHGVIVGGDRYHFPAIPFFAMLAASAALAMINEEFRSTLKAPK